MNYQLNLIVEALEGTQQIAVSDRLMAKALGARHCRSGKIDACHPAREARGVAVKAFGYDELGNVVALCADGKIRQFIRD